MPARRDDGAGTSPAPDVFPGAPAPYVHRAGRHVRDPPAHVQNLARGTTALRASRCSGESYSAPAAQRPTAKGNSILREIELRACAGIARQWLHCRRAKQRALGGDSPRTRPFAAALSWVHASRGRRSLRRRVAFIHEVTLAPKQLRAHSEVHPARVRFRDAPPPVERPLSVAAQLVDSHGPTRHDSPEV